ncbi:hypothetical protein ABPG73_019135 [Tetrahymena malaccensis]
MRVYHNFIKFTISVYEYTFLPISMIIPFNGALGIKILNLLSSLILSILIILSDFDYSFQNGSDCLQKQGNISAALMFQVAQKFILSINLQFSRFQIQQYLLTLLGITNILLQLVFKLYVERSVRICYVILNIAFTYVFALISLNQISNLGLSSFTQVLLISVLVIKIYLAFENKNQQQIQYGEQILNYGEYENDPISLLIEQISIYHNQTCHKYPDCFCNFNIDQDIKQNLLSSEKRKLFFMDFIINCFESNKKILSQKKKTLQIEAHLIYINFLIEVCESAIPSTQEIFYLEQNNYCSVLQQMYLQQLRYKQKQKFSLRLYKEHQEINLQLNNVKLFEDNAKQINYYISKCLKQKEFIIILLNSDQINLQELEKISREYFQERSKLLSLLKTTKFSENLNDYTAFSFFEQAIDEIFFHKFSVQNGRKQKQLLQGDNIKEFLNEQASCFFVSLNRTSFGQVLRYDKQFSQTFQFNKNLSLHMNSIIPDEITEIHNKLVQSAFSDFNISYDLNKFHKNVLLGIDQNGYAKSISINMKLQVSYEKDQFGVMCSIKQIDHDKHFILINTISSQFICGTQKFVQQYLSKYGTNKGLKQLSIKNLIPSLNQVQKNANKKVLLFLPNEQENFNQISSLLFAQNFNNIQQLNLLTQFSQNSIFQICLKSHQITNEKFTILEISDIQKVEEQELQTLINDLKYQILKDSENYKHLSYGLSQMLPEKNFCSRKIETKSSPQQKAMNLCEQTMSEIMEQQYLNSNIVCKGFDLIQILSTSNRYNYNELNSTQKFLISSNEIYQNKASQLLLDQTQKMKSLENTEDNSLSKSENKSLHEKIYIEQASYENANKTNSPYKKVKLQKMKQLRKQEQQQQQQEQTSIDSKYISKKEKLKRYFISKLEIRQCKKRISYVKLAVLLSIFGIICIWALTITYYFLARTLFVNQRDKLIHVSLPMSLRSISSTQMYYSQYIRYVDQDIFPGIKQNKSWQDFKQTNIQRIKQDFQQFDDIMTQIIRSDKQYYPYFQNITEIPFTFIQLRDDKSYNRVQTNQTTSYYYFLYIYYQMVHRYATQLYDVLNEEAFDVNNFLHFNTILTELQNIIEKEAQQNMIYITQNYQQISYIVIAISFMILIQLQTIKYCITLNTQTYLKLITTFSPESLTEIRKELDIVQKNFDYFKNNQCYQQVSNNEQISKTDQYQCGKNNLQQSQFIQGVQKNQKRKMISVTSHLPLFSIKLIVVQVLIVTLLVIPPQIVSYITSMQTKECQINLSQMRLIYQRMYPNNQIYMQDQYDNEMPIFAELNSQSLSDLSNFMGQTIGQKRYYQEYYNDFFYKVLKENICDPIKNYPQFTNFTASNFQYQNCQKIRNQILTKGFQISVTYFYDQIKPIYEILQDPQDSDSKIIFAKWLQQFDLLEFDQYVDYLLNTINTLKNFIIQMSNDYLEYMDFLQLIIMISYNSFIIILCIFLAKYVVIYIEQESRFSKQILEIISLDHIINNNYITNQLQK